MSTNYFLKSFLVLVSAIVIMVRPVHAEITKNRAQDLSEKIRSVLLSHVTIASQSQLIVNVNQDGDESMAGAFNGDVSVFGKAKVVSITLNDYGRSIGTAAAFAAMVCHEAGHHFGGDPFNSDLQNLKLSNEGQADYWAARYCIPWILEEQVLSNDELLYISGAHELCTKQYADSKKAKVCEFGMAMGSAWRVVHQNCMKHYPADANIGQFIDLTSLEDATFIYELYLSPFHGVSNEHPKDDCRLKTYIAGALGKERPSCWYNP